METKEQTQPDIFQENCLSRQVLQLIADQWTPLVIYALEDGTMRFGQLLKRINGISKKMLTRTLRSLERNGLVQRVVYPVVPPVVEYTLTPLGQTLIEPVRALQVWAYEHLQEVAQSQAAYDQRDQKPLYEATAALVQQR
ncbi:winged helix-turn-helix transcriptional regulator [Dictyobacter aurantiacus]|uniref:HxlR family transcriptional regulator n=1 Tax=Dictyobacter aurantiacus TaxID=1936993 RepID=A0A401ZMG4_9CHLR|nr:helix-turn-helix domain-containing protein [Dictyobacter aurantiacus]GCE08032.1 HxlR family transcriptional regulator [Dictyobacter aurantiacus]